MSSSLSVSMPVNSRQVLPSPAPSDQYGSELNSNHIVTTSPMPTPASTSSRQPKKRTKSQSRVTKRSKKKLETPPASPPNRHSPETAGFSISETSTPQNEPQPQDMPPNIMEEQYILPPPGQLGQPYGHPMPYLLPDPQPYPVMQPMPSMQQGGYMNYLLPRQGYGGPPQIQSPYEYSRHSASHSSKIEDVSMGQNPLVQPQQTSQDPNHPSVRSQYILATQDSVWRTMH